MNLLIMGPPGSGKGTQSQLISSELGIVHISTGDIFRNAIENQTDLGKIASEYMEKGEYVPDELTNKMVEEEIKSLDNDFILDGYPRTTNQAEFLDELLEKLNKKIESVISLEISNDIIIDRLSKRRVCLNCGKAYHLVNNPTKVPGICDACGSEIHKRNDDKEEIIINRLKVYNDQSKELLDYYKNKLIGVNSNLSTQEVKDLIFEKIRND